MAARQDVNTPVIVTIGIVSALLLIVVAIGLEAWFRSEEQSQMAVMSRRAVYMPLVSQTLEQQSKINGYRWIDSQKQIAAIPIEEAMKIVAANGTGVVAPATQRAE